jgi:WD40 repeat protein
MADIFVSYSRVDEDFGRHLHRELSQIGHDVWIDWEDIPLTTEWWSEICEGIENANNFLLIMSPASIGSPICQLEIDYAIRINKRIIPIVYREVDKDNAFENIIRRIHNDDFIRAMLKGHDGLSVARNNWQVLGALNWIFFKQEDDFTTKFSELITAIQLDLSHVKIHTRLLVRALEWERVDKNPSFLLSGDEITSAEDWLQAARKSQKAPEPTHLHNEYIFASRERDLSEKRRLRNLRRATWIAAIIGSLAIVATLAIGFAAISATNALATVQIQANDAQQSILQSTAVIATQLLDIENANATLNAVEAEVQAGEHQIESIRLGEIANGILDNSGNPETAALLATIALNTSYTANADEALIRAFSRLFTEKIYIGHEDSINEVAFSSDMAFIATASDDNTVRTWDTFTGQELTVFDEHQASILSLDISADNGLIISSDGNGKLILWNAQSGNIVWEKTLPNVIASDVEFDPSSTRILIGASDNKAYILDSTNGDVLLTYNGHDDNAELYSITSVTWSNDGQYALTGSNDRGVILWDTQTLETTGLFPAVGSIRTGGAVSVALSHDNAYALVGSVDGVAQIWDVEDETMLRSFNSGRRGPLLGESSPVLADFVLQDTLGFVVYTGSDDSRKLLWQELITPLQATHTMLGHWGEITSVEISPDDRYILTGSSDGTARLWTVYQGGVVSYAPSEDIVELLFSPDGRLLVADSRSDLGSSMYVWDIRTGELLLNEGISSANVAHIEMSPQGNYLLAVGGSSSSHYMMWNLNSLEPVEWFNALGWDRFGGVIFSADEEYIILYNHQMEGTRRYIRTQRVFETQSGNVVDLSTIETVVAETLSALPSPAPVELNNINIMPARPFNQYGRFSVIQVSPDGSAMAVADREGKIVIIPTDYQIFLAEVCTRLLIDLTPEQRQEYGITGDGTTCPNNANQEQ